MSVTSSPVRGARQASAAEHPVFNQLGWFAGVCVLAFLIPYLLTSVADVNHDAYYGIYFVLALFAVATYATVNRVDTRRLVSQNWRLSMVLGALAAVFVVWNVLAREDGTPHPSGPYFVFEILWRGAAYGAVDAVLLTMFPAMVAFSLMHNDVNGLSRRVTFGAITLVLAIIVTATYHLGYDQYREDGLKAPRRATS